MTDLIEYIQQQEERMLQPVLGELKKIRKEMQGLKPQQNLNFDAYSYLTTEHQQDNFSKELVEQIRRIEHIREICRKFKKEKSYDG